MSNKRPEWYYSTIKRIARYTKQKDRADILEMRLQEQGAKLTPVYSSQPHGSGVSDPTGNQGDKTMQDQEELRAITIELKTLALAISKLSEEKQLIITEKYIQGEMDKYVFWVLRKQYGIRSRDTYYRFKDEAVMELAEILGEKKI
jgi:hypothetical protein